MLPNILFLAVTMAIAAPISYLVTRLIPRPTQLKLMDVAYSSVASVVTLPMFDHRPGIKGMILTAVTAYTAIRATWLR